MIAWILRELEKNPTSVFHKRDLLKISEQQFEELRGLGLLAYVQPDLNSDTYPCSLPCENACPMDIAEVGGRLFAICPNDSEIDPVPLDSKDLDKYTFCMEKFLERVRRANSLEGKLHRIDQDYLYLGHATCKGRRVGFVFGFTVAHKSLLELTGVKSLCSDDYYLVLLSPVSLIEDLPRKRQLDRKRIIQTSLTTSLDLQTYVFSVKELLSELAEREADPEQKTELVKQSLLSVDRERLGAICGGKSYSITERQAEFLEKLAEKPGVWIAGSQLKNDYRERLDKVKNSLPKAILKLIDSHTRNGYRLKEST